MPGVEQTDQETTSFTHEDYAEVDRVLKAMLHIVVSPLNAGRVQVP
jgi:hypothetical protein